MMQKATGLLLATMEPPAALEGEFQDWYDTEHFPERATCEGFLTANRFTCLDGWPRYLALYDLADIEVMRGPAYKAVAVDRYSVWTRRIVSQVWGQYRAEATQIYPGEAMLGAKGSPARLALYRFRNAPASAQGAMLDGLRALYERQPETAQLRLFEAKQPDGTDHIALIELHAPFVPAPGAVAVLKDALRYLDMVNVYALYRRRWAGEFPKGT
jgi:hypothetical protein